MNYDNPQYIVFSSSKFYDALAFCMYIYIYIRIVCFCLWGPTVCLMFRSAKMEMVKLHGAVFKHEIWGVWISYEDISYAIAAMGLIICCAVVMAHMAYGIHRNLYDNAGMSLRQDVSSNSGNGLALLQRESKHMLFYCSQISIYWWQS